jgi:hypothetical protein
MIRGHCEIFNNDSDIEYLKKVCKELLEEVETLKKEIKEIKEKIAYYDMIIIPNNIKF